MVNLVTVTNVKNADSSRAKLNITLLSKDADIEGEIDAINNSKAFHLK